MPAAAGSSPKRSVPARSCLEKPPPSSRAWRTSRRCSTFGRNASHGWRASSARDTPQSRRFLAHANTAICRGCAAFRRLRPLPMTTLPPIQSDRSARARAVRHAGSVLVQAPAGSGKTTLLTQRYLRLLATVDAPERILALTFTRRAAQEMRERVMQALQAASSIECPATMNPRTWELGIAAKRHLGSVGIDVERHPSRLRIETIDAFNAWLAGQLPITAGAGSRLNLIEKARPLYEEAARRALAHDEPDRYGTAVDRVLALDDQRWQSLVTL